MVIQQLGLSGTSSYRVVVYGDDFKPRRADFSSAQILLGALRAAVPHINWAGLSWNPLGDGMGSIVYEGELELRESTLIDLGLK